MSQPFLDKFYLPSKAIRTKPEENKETQLKVVTQKRRIGFALDVPDNLTKEKDGSATKIKDSALQNQPTYV